MIMDYAYEANLPANWASLDTGIDDDPETDEGNEPDYIPGLDDGEAPGANRED